MAICASSTRCSTLPTSLYLYASPPPKPSSLKAQTLQQQLPTPSSSSLLSDDSLTTAAAAQAVTLASAASNAAREAVSSTLALTQMALLLPREAETGNVDSGVGVQNGRKRKKKRTRRRGSPEDMQDGDSGDSFGLGSACCYLSSREEAECARCLKEWARLEATRDRLREVKKREPTMSQWAYAAGMKKSSLEKLLGRVKECKNRITRSYRRLIVSVATPYSGRGLGLHDLIQEGSIGLLRGTERFDHSKGNKLSTYVYWWIRQAILKAVATKSRIVRLPGSMQGPVAKVAKANSFLNARLGRSPTHAEIAQMVRMHNTRVRRVICERSRLPLSLDQPMSDRGNITVKEITPGPDGLRPETMMSRQVMKQEIGRLLKVLTKREEHVVRLYFGMDGETAKSCEEIGRVINLSRERVRQIRDTALVKLQESSQSRDLNSVHRCNITN